MRSYPVALVVLALAGAYALASVPPVAPAPAAPPEPAKVGDTWTNPRGMKFAYIPAGEFLMGSPETETGRYKDETPHRVTISKPFLLGVYEVTQAQWKAVMGSNPSSFTGDDNLPVEQVSWTDATNFCTKLSTSEGAGIGASGFGGGGGRAGVAAGGTGHRYRLPTEAEWEYACRAGTTTAFNTGDTISTDDANYNGIVAYGDGKKGVSREKTTPVGSFKPNAWGLYDMHGNVWEWCADWLADYPATAVSDPKGPSSGGGLNLEFRIMRGGSFGYLPQNCRSATRHSNEAKSTASSVGFRVAVEMR